MAQNQPLAGSVGITDAHPHEEAVELRFGQRIGAVVFLRILGRNHLLSGSVSGMVRPPDQDLAFVHGLEQRRLCLGSAAVDLVRQQEIGEDGSGLELEFLGVRIVDGSAPSDVARQHVAGELQAMKVTVDAPRQRLRERSLAHAGDIFDKKVTAGEQAHQGEPDSFGLAPENQVERILGAQ